MDFTNLTDLIGSGAVADVYRFDKYAVKLFKEHCSKGEAFFEAAIHTAVENTKLPVPKVHQVLKIKNRWAIVMDMINGVTMKDIIFNDICNLNLHINSIVDLQYKMHQIDVAGLNRLNEGLALRISSTNLLDNNEKQHLVCTLNSFESDNKLCHGDFHFLNLIKTHNDIVIIDWVDATCGNPEADICKTYLLYLLYANEIADLYLDVYCKKSEKERKDILKWLPIIAAARLCDNKPNEVETLIKIIR
jgi:tRNA A-37 threonylcarbamoyl transferase component Bud32